MSYENLLAFSTKVQEPKYFHEAVKDALWWKAMAEDNALPPGKKSISCKWFTW